MKMFNKTGLLALLFAAFVFTGCIEIQTLITVDSSGAGSIEETVMLSREIIDMITELQNSFAPDSVKAEPFQFYNEDELRNNAAQYGSGVIYVSSEKLSSETKEGYTVRYEFTDINNLKVNQNPNSRVKLESFEDEAEVQEEFITFNFIKDTPSEIRIQMPLESQVGEADSSVEEETGMETDTTGMTEQLVNIFKDLKFSLALDVKGNIIKTNAAYVENSRVTLFEINFAELISNAEKLKEFRETEPQNFEQVKKMLQDIPGLKVEPNNQLFIKFK